MGERGHYLHVAGCDPGSYLRIAVAVVDRGHLFLAVGDPRPLSTRSCG